MEKNNTNVVDEVIEQVEKGGRLKERAIRKIKKEKDVRQYVSDIFSFVIGLLLFLILLEVPELVSYFYVDHVKTLNVVFEIVYVGILFILLVHNYITLRKLNSK